MSRAPRFTLNLASGRSRGAPPAFQADRREALKWLTAGATLAMAACGRPHEEIIPYVDQPEGLIPGIAQRYATTVTLGGYGRGAMATCYEGRPTKLEGSPKHPYSLGSTDVFVEAEVLNLYDPGRLKAVENADGPASWDALRAALAPRLAALKGRGGQGLRLYTGRITSPTELRLISALQQAYPKMAWRRFEPLNDDNARAGARLAFGRPLSVSPRLDKAKAIVCLDADPLGPGPGQIVDARGFAAGRKTGPAMSRLYVAEGGWTLSGAAADHRLAIHPQLVRNVALRIAAAFGRRAPPLVLPPGAAAFADACARDLKAHAGAALVLVGPAQPPELHALAHWLNGQLAAPVAAIAPVDPHPDDHMASLAALAQDLHAGRVSDLIVLGGDPVYDAPGDLGLGQAFQRAPFRLHLCERVNQTGALCTWRAPLSHALESWGDVRALDGTASLVQPTVRPLYDTRTAAQGLAMLADLGGAPAYDLVRQTWAGSAAPPAIPEGVADPAPVTARSGPADYGAAFERFWTQALSDGVIAGAAPAPAAFPAARAVDLAPAPAPSGLTLALSADPTVYDGRYAENAWLQECPKPMTAEVWGANLAVSPQDAKALGLADFDHVRLSAHGRSVIVAVKVVSGQAVGVLGGFIGGGRASAGPIGTDVGVDFGPLRGGASPWRVPVQLAKVQGHGGAPAFAAERRLEGDGRKLSPEITLGALPGLSRHPVDPTPEHPPSLLAPAAPYTPSWAMVIDAALCIGCNACVVSCQAENNVPVVGPHEVARGRDMHWLRIDTYDVGGQDANGGADHRPAFQPVPCMQCEHAPCEPVCPVEASVHDHEGLNDQVYNRCIGTRFCQSNCPYKVRRFNWYGYAHDQAYGDMGAESVKAQKNPEVTVRARGVMEKCTYCVQRISAARRAAEKDDRPIGAHEVVTACQGACPTQAISFGDMTDTASGVAALREDPRHYALLGELGTRPRTTYLARLRNPDPTLKGEGA